MEKVTKKPGLLAALLTAAAGLAGIAVWPFLLIAGGLFGYLLTAGGFVPFALSGVIFAGVAFLWQNTNGLLIVALVLPAAVCMGIMMRKKAAYFDIAFACAAICTGAFYLICSLPDLISGSPAFYTLQQNWDTFIRNFVSAFSQGPYQAPPEQLAIWEQLGRELSVELVIYMPAIICTVGAMMGLTNLLFCKRLCRLANAPIKPMRPFLLWQLPQSFLYGMLTMAAGTFIAFELNVFAIDSVIPAVYVIAAIPFAIQGLCVLWFTQHARRSGMGSLMFLLILLLFTFPLSVLSLAIVGLVEQLFHLRRRYLQRGNGENND